MWEFPLGPYRRVSKVLQGPTKIILRNILHMYTIGAVIVCFKPLFFCFIPKFPKDFKKFDQVYIEVSQFRYSNFGNKDNDHSFLDFDSETRFTSTEPQHPRNRDHFPCFQT